MSKKVRNAFAWLLKAAIAGLLAMAVLTVFCIMYWYNGLHIKSLTGATNYNWLPNQLILNMAEGFCAVRMDENGYNNPEFIPDKDIDLLLMGTSHMLAAEVNADESTAYYLNELCPSIYTYNIGMDNNPIYSCVKNMQSAVQTFHPHKFVVVEVDDVALNIGDMQAVLDGTYGGVPAYDSGIMYFLQKYVPVAKQAYRQLRAAGVFANAEAPVNAAVDYTSDEYRATLDEFLSMAVEPVDKAGSRLIIVVHPNTTLGEDGQLVLQINKEALDVMTKSCSEHGITLIDMSDSYQELFCNEHVLPYGFINTQVGVGHMNKYGHRVMAEEILDVISTMEQTGE